MIIKLDPLWINLKSQCKTSAHMEKYNNLTLQILNGYCGTYVAIESLVQFIKAN